jgi:type III restriction enzyme
MHEEYLYKTIETEKNVILRYKPKVLTIPPYISQNIKHELFAWQKSALENFLIYQDRQSSQNTPTHLMFNMATGTGKTLLMAAMILYYYKQGYRHFLFFVNQKNIVDKTENNFINTMHNKYLFCDKIVIDDRIVKIRPVDNFSDNPHNIELKFTTIHKLYNDIHNTKENQTTLLDLRNKNIVMLADEAHHLNTDTSKLSKQKELVLSEITNKTSESQVERLGWEHTVIDLIFKKQGAKPNKNVLLEYSATIPNTDVIMKKYQDKIIYRFDLKQFLQQGYTKEINLISSTLGQKERILLALLFAWYRHTIAIKYNIHHFKPVTLFRSRTIEESKQDYGYFLSFMANLSSQDFTFVADILPLLGQTNNLFEQGRSRTKMLLDYIKINNINYREIASWLKNNYTEKNTIITNSGTNSTKESTTTDIDYLLNNLEDKTNNIRAIFTVNRLTEGWDVLNLFDIVRLYQGQNSGGSDKKTPEATTQEKQLIGRGVRYYPFSYKDYIPNKRKFDDNLNHELRILEELYYYTYDEDSKYISHLKHELRKDGYITDNKIVKTFDLKEQFKQSDFYKWAKIWYNKPIPNPERRKTTLVDIEPTFSFEYIVKDATLDEQQVDFTNQYNNNQTNNNHAIRHTINIKIKDIEPHIFNKAINIKAKEFNSLLQFRQISQELDIKTMDELQSKFLAEFCVKIIINRKKDYNDIPNSDKLRMILLFLDKLINQLKQHIAPYIGSDFIIGDLKDFYNTPKIKSVNQSDVSKSEHLEQILKQNDWYVLDSFNGTDQEMALVEFITKIIGNLEDKYTDIYLLRNEEVYKIYDFKQGRGFQPDFILFLTTKDKKMSHNVDSRLYYQIFIEPKQANYITSDNEIWKQDFLEQITKKYGVDNIITSDNPLYRLIGLPFYNNDEPAEQLKYFADKFNQYLL